MRPLKGGIKWCHRWDLGETQTPPVMSEGIILAISLDEGMCECSDMYNSKFETCKVEQIPCPPQPCFRNYRHIYKQNMSTNRESPRLYDNLQNFPSCFGGAVLKLTFVVWFSHNCTSWTSLDVSVLPLAMVPTQCIIFHQSTKTHISLKLFSP